MTETSFAQLGLGGIALFIVFWFIRWLCQHLDKNNKVLAGVSKALISLKESQKKNTIATDKNSAVTCELITYFRSLNGNLLKK